MPARTMKRSRQNISSPMPLGSSASGTNSGAERAEARIGSSSMTKRTMPIGAAMRRTRNNPSTKTKTSPRRTTARRRSGLKASTGSTSWPAGSRRRGINLCVDLSATPFYIQGSGNEVGKPFPWIVSDFGLLDAIESGLVKIPQLPSRDVTGADEAAYFNIWRWVQAKAKEDGYGSNLTPEIVMNYASAPINLLAAEWHQRFRNGKQFVKAAAQAPGAARVHRRLPGYRRRARGPFLARKRERQLRRFAAMVQKRPGQEVTVRIDSKVIEDIEEGGTKDETRRLRFILDTVGKAEWPGGKVPDEWSELVRKHNEKVASEDNDGSLKWIDERIPPGRDIRCIVSVCDAGRRLGRQHRYPYRRPAPFRLAIVVRASRRPRACGARAMRSTKKPRCSRRKPPRFSACRSS